LSSVSEPSSWYTLALPQQKLAAAST
jgi:hypothetical protein